MKYVFDIDGTICSNSAPDYAQAQPFVSRINQINKLYDAGHTIIFLTARGMGRHKNNSAAAITEFYELTSEQLNSWGVKHHELFLGKPSGDIYIDDKGIKDEDFFGNELCP
jgi:capsule biosynthesis phosphatase